MATYLPSVLLDSLEGVPGFERRAFEEVHSGGEQNVSIRLNPFKCEGGAFPVTLESLKQAAVPWCSQGYYLKERPSFTLDPLFHAGAYYVQEASSMFLEQAVKHTVDISEPLKVLDLCAAPGGKSTLVSSLLSPDSLLVTNEVIRSRVPVLADNVTRWGVANTVVTSNDPKDFGRLKNFFDLIIVDAPCSGSGLFRKDPEAVQEWSPENVTLCSQRQRRILADIMPALKEGGVLVYCTCSYSPEENEMICDWILDNFKVNNITVSAVAEWGNVVSHSTKHQAEGYRFYPDKVKGEGFFLSCFRKMDEDTIFPEKKWKAPKQDDKRRTIISRWIKDPEAFDLISLRDHDYIVPRTMRTVLPDLQEALHIRQAGVCAGRIVESELIPAHALALSTLIESNIPGVKIDREQAIRYLRKETLELQTELRGWTLAQFAGFNLGWIKILPGRINNYFPKEWRILQQGY